MKEIVDPIKMPESVISSICSVIVELSKDRPVDALIAYSHHFCDHSYAELSDLIYTERSKHGPRMISKEGIEWRVAKTRNMIRRHYDKHYGRRSVSTEEGLCSS